MRTSLAGRSGLAGLGTRLLLALALAACGAESGGENGAKNTVPAADSTTSAVTTAAAADTCTGPPPAFSVALLNGASWKDFKDSLAAQGVAFPNIPGNVSEQAVKLCRNCTPVKMEIRASNFTPCLKPGDLAGGGRRIVGEYIAKEPIQGQPGWDPIPAGASIYLFAHANGRAATMVYEDSGKTNMGPVGAWQFWYCEHDTATAVDKKPRAQWRPRGPAPPGTPGGDIGGGEGGGTYGWMACASGCCQFYTPPPNDVILTTPPNAADQARDTVGGPMASTRPYWCRRNH